MKDHEIINHSESLNKSLAARGVDIRTFRVIKDILYPGVQKTDTLLMALDYCKERGLDIMKRPIQIVPVWSSKTKTMEDTIWPSITEIRITAARTGRYAGRSTAVYGEEITENLGGISTTYPKYCEVTVYRLVEGVKCEFPAKVFWKEAYKTAKNDTAAPNSMWQKRAFGQIEKCAEAAALRSAFPEEIGGDYISEEAFSHDDNINAAKSKTSSIFVQEAVIPVKAPEMKIVNQPDNIDLEELKQMIVDAETLEELEELQSHYDNFKHFSPVEVKEIRNYIDNKKDNL